MSVQFRSSPVPFAARLPFFFGWVIIVVAFLTVAVSVTTRTAFSLMFPPIVDEFGWDRGLAAGAFSFGFLVSAVISPVVGRVMDRRGPRFVIEIGVVLTAAGLLGATMISTPWQLYATLGVLVGAGANCMSFSVQSQYLPNWFVRRRALATGIAFSGVGVGAILILPWLQTIILTEGWRSACWALGLMTLFVLLPINLIVTKRPQDVGLLPDGAKEAEPPPRAGPRPLSIRTGPLSNGRSPRRSARTVSGGSASASSARAMLGTRCRFTRRSTWSKSASAQCKRPGRWAS